MDIIYEKIAVFKNKINTNEWINLIELVSNESYQLEVVERRPHLTMTIPMVFDVRDTSNSIKLKTLFYNIFMPQLLEYMNYYDNFGIISRKNLLVISKLLDGHEMEFHNDSNDQKHIIAMMYLNDDYYGGEIIFRDLGLEYKPQAGDFIIYPGSLSHGVKMMKGNPRYSIGLGLLDPSFIDKKIEQL